MRNISYHTEAGVDGSNEDHVLVSTHPLNPGLRVCMLADGVGDRPDGALASRIACETAHAEASKCGISQLFQTDTWREIFAKASLMVERRCKGQTSLLAFAVNSRFMCGASVGDCKLFSRFAANRITELTSRQWKNPPLGAGQIIVTPFFEQVPPGTVYMAASDGAWKYAGFEDIEEALSMRDTYNAIDYLRAAVIDHQGSLPDDFSVIELMI